MTALAPLRPLAGEGGPKRRMTGDAKARFARPLADLAELLCLAAFLCGLALVALAAGAL